MWSPQKREAPTVCFATDFPKKTPKSRPEANSTTLPGPDPTGAGLGRRGGRLRRRPPLRRPGLYPQRRPEPELFSTQTAALPVITSPATSSPACTPSSCRARSATLYSSSRVCSNSRPAFALTRSRVGRRNLVRPGLARFLAFGRQPQSHRWITATLARSSHFSHPSDRRCATMTVPARSFGLAIRQFCAFGFCNVVCTSSQNALSRSSSSLPNIFRHIASTVCGWHSV